MITEACFEVVEALTVPGVRPSAIERALNAFADDLTRAELAGEASSELVAELRTSIAAVNRASLRAADFAVMIRQVSLHFENAQRPCKEGLLVRLPNVNATACRLHAPVAHVDARVEAAWPEGD
jgi:hypothetical protein